MKCKHCDGDGVIVDVEYGHADKYGCKYCDGKGVVEPLTNEEYYTETTAELARLLAWVCNILLIKVYEDGGYVPKEYDEEDSGFWLNWLKEKHNGR